MTPEEEAMEEVAEWKESLAKQQSGAQLAAARGSAALVHHWTDRRTRKLHNAKVAAAKGDYTTALKEAAEADAILLCLQDLNTEMPPNAKLSDRPTQTP